MSDFVLNISVEPDNLDNAQIEEEQSWKKRSIYKLPSLILELNEKAYQPQLVSFGPYHHGEPNLKPMEDHKQRAFRHFLRRSSKSLDEIFNSMVQVAQDLKDSYDSLQPEWQDNTKKFVMLMIVDGCFMLEILRVATQKSSSDYSKDDPIFGPHGELYVMPFIKRDMLLLENQLPILVLSKLKGIDGNAMEDEDTLNKQILQFYNNEDPGSKMGECLHVLDLYRKSLLTKDPKPAKPKDRKGRNGTTVVRSATELKEAGIRFKRTRNKSLRDISFEHGILRLPTFVVDDTTESTFLNLVAFERCHVGAGHDITSFICFMDNIVDHDGDIRLLSSKGIIHNVIGSDNVAANLFNTMSKDLMMDPSSHLNRVHMSILYYCREPWHKWRAMFIHTYFRSPWAIVSLIAAVILFGLTAVSTAYDVMGK